MVVVVRLREERVERGSDIPGHWVRGRASVEVGVQSHRLLGAGGDGLEVDALLGVRREGRALAAGEEGDQTVDGVLERLETLLHPVYASARQRQSLLLLG